MMRNELIPCRRLGILIETLGLRQFQVDENPDGCLQAVWQRTCVNVSLHKRKRFMLRRFTDIVVLSTVTLAYRVAVLLLKKRKQA